MQVAQLLPGVCNEQSPPTSHYVLTEGACRGDFRMRKLLALLALAVLTTVNTGCSARFRNWLHRGSPCGTTMAAPAVMGAPVAVGTPVAAPQAAPAMAPVMAPAPMQQVVAPQPIYCCPQPVCPQPVQCCPQPVPCCPPSEYDPCQSGGMMPGWQGGPMEGMVIGPFECDPTTSFDDGYLVPGTETPVDSDTYNADPGPAREN